MLEREREPTVSVTPPVSPPAAGSRGARRSRPSSPRGSPPPGRRSPLSMVQHAEASESAPAESGDGDVGSAQLDSGEREREQRRLAKGKGRMRDLHAADEDSTFPPELADDDELEEKRVSETLAAWSRSASEKRAASRRSAPLIIMPPNLPDLSRFSTDLFRRASRTRSGSGGGDDERSRKWSRITSLVSQEDGPAYVAAGSDANASPIELAPMSPSSHAPTNPFASPPRTTASLPSLLANASPTKRLTTSKFIEDLPPSHGATTYPNPAELPHAASHTEHYPASPPLCSSDAAFAATDPFIDGFQVDDAFLGSTDSFSTVRSSRSNTAFSVISDEGTVMDASGGYRSRGRRGTLLADGRSAHDHAGLALHRHTGSLDDQTYEYRTSRIGDAHPERPPDAQGPSEERLGFLEWLLCGCWGREGAAGQQEGRTNPGE